MRTSTKMSQRVYTESKWIFKWYSMEPMSQDMLLWPTKCTSCCVWSSLSVWCWKWFSDRTFIFLGFRIIRKYIPVTTPRGQKAITWSSTKNIIKSTNFRRKKRVKRKAANESVKGVYLASKRSFKGQKRHVAM